MILGGELRPFSTTVPVTSPASTGVRGFGVGASRTEQGDEAPFVRARLTASLFASGINNSSSSFASRFLQMLSTEQLKCLTHEQGLVAESSARRMDAEPTWG